MNNKRDMESDSILIVEDDLDLNTFLLDELGEEFEVYSASDGREGLALAQKHLPDLVVTDLMMPEMDGIELCKYLKQGPDTAHIPVIMLTAKSDVTDQVKGLQTGADDYVTKPFVFELLQARIRNLLENRRILRERLRKELLNDQSSTPEIFSDQSFMEKMLKVLEEHSPESDFSAEDLAKVMGMSISTLHRKLKSLTGETPARLIWQIRLKKAAKLLNETDLRITEIAFMVGYTDSNHFGRQFKQQYGRTPSEYRRK